MKDRMKDRISSIFLIGAIICGFFAAVSFFPDENASEKIKYAEMTLDNYLNFRHIQQEYGTLAAENWYYRISGLQAIADLRYKSPLVDRAVSAGFRVSPDPEKDAKFIKEYERLIGKYPDLVRRQDFSERFKDSMAWLGGLAIFIFLSKKFSKKLWY